MWIILSRAEPAHSPPFGLLISATQFWSNGPSIRWESVGHYEGKDTLVVDTIGISTKTFIDNYRTPHTDQLHVVERFRLEPGGEMMEVMITVEDPGAFTTPWSAVQRLALQRPRQWTEDICAENNAGYFNYDVVPLPQADRPDFWDSPRCSVHVIADKAHAMYASQYAQKVRR
jgi:hypothetical protein